MIGIGGGKLRSKRGFGLFYKNDRVDTVEIIGVLVFILFAANAFGLLISDVATNYPWLYDFA